MQKRVLLTIIAASILLATAGTVQAARTDSKWNERLNSYLETIWPEGRSLLINGSNKYLNFNSVSGTSGYGFRDNGGAIEVKDSGGSWASISTAASAGDPFAWTPTTNYGAAANATSSVLWLQNGFQASSTSHLVTASTTNISATYATSTSGFFGSLSVGGLTGLLKATAGAISTAVSGTDYEVPVTAGDGLTRTANDFDCDTASGSIFGCLASADWTTFNNKQATIATTWPVTLSGATIGFNGLSTSTAAVTGNIPYFSGVNTFANVATSSLSVDSSISSSGTLGSQVGGTASQLSINLANPNTWTAHQIFSSTRITNATTTNATSTNIDITGLLTFNGVTGSTWTSFCSTITGSADLCDGSDASGAAAVFAWTPTTNFGATANATSTPIWFQNGLQASTTSHLVTGAFGDGSATDPSIAFTNDSDTGLFLFNTNKIGFVTGGSAKFTIDTNGTFAANSNTSRLIQSGDGSATTPGFGFFADTNTGMFRSTTDVLGFATAGVERLTVDASGNFGIGTTTPAATLQVSKNDATRLLGTSIVLSDQGASTDLKHWGINTLNGDLRIATLSDNLASLSPKAVITSAGKFGVGSTSPFSTFSITSTGTLGIPFSANPTLSSGGQLAIDSTSASSSLKYHDNTAERVLYDVQYRTFTIASSTLNSYAGQTASSTIPLGVASPHGETWTEMTCYTDSAGTAELEFGDGTNWMDYQLLTTTATTDSSLTNNTFTMREKRFVRIGKLATSPASITCEVGIRQSP